MKKNNETKIIIMFLSVIFYALTSFLFGCTAIVLSALKLYFGGMILILVCLYSAFRAVSTTAKLECEMKK